MTSTLKTMFALVCIALATVSLAGCGGGDDKDSGKGGANGTGDSGSTSEQGAAYRVVDQFVNHMANREFGEARALVANGGGADILDAYVRGIDTQMANPATSEFIDPMFAGVTESFANASISVTEQDEDSAVVQLTMGDKTHDLDVTTLDGSEWTIALPGDLLPEFGTLLGEAIGGGDGG